MDNNIKSASPSTSKEPELISKKELLELTGISYGQLYRWKRERLIPEEWFVKQSAFTGQETFFERGRILERVKAILALKEGKGYSLEEMADIFNPEASGCYTAAELAAAGLIPPGYAALVTARLGDEPMAASGCAYVVAVCRAAAGKNLPEEAAAGFFARALDLAGAAAGADAQCVFFTRGGEPHVALALGQTAAKCEFRFDSGIQVLWSADFGTIISEISIKLKNKETEGED